MRQTGYRPRPVPADLLPAMRFHGFKPRHIKRQLGQLYKELIHAREPLSKGFTLDDDSYNNILKMFLARDAALPAYNTMSLPDYVDAFHRSRMSTLLTMIEPMVVFMASVYPPMDQLSFQMRRWGAFEDPFGLDDEEQEVSQKMWERASKLLGKELAPEDMPRRFISYYVRNADAVEDKIKLTAADLLEMDLYEAKCKKLGLEDIDYFPATVQLLRRTIREGGFEQRDIVRAACTITLSHADKPPAILATEEGMRAMTEALSPYKPKFLPSSDALGKPFTLN